MLSYEPRLSIGRARIPEHDSCRSVGFDRERRGHAVTGMVLSRVRPPPSLYFMTASRTNEAVAASRYMRELLRLVWGLD